ncbi:DsbA family protein [Ahrensia kielensis]|uniref:DsbA family protein n=1 Tax=Ahrensia kielensis TaxID=76980 RepID=UPI00035FB0A7|nr:hypothetical protein [Ahrensia kielensis]
MTPTINLHYLFDPLCGWCYGASDTIVALGQHPSINLNPLVTGLFSYNGARPIKSFAAKAWANDQRIAALSGKEFSEFYRRDVLGSEVALLDSTVATQAVTAVANTTPDRVVEALVTIQTARYVHGKDVTSPVVVALLLEDLGLLNAAARIKAPDKSLLQLVRESIVTARQMMSTFNLQGVPALIAGAGGENRVLNADVLYSGTDAVLTSLDLA